MLGRSSFRCLTLLALLGGGLAQASDESRIISLNSFTIDTSRPVPAVAESLAAPVDRALDEMPEIVLVKFPGPVTARQEKALREASLRVYTYLPHFAYLVKMPAGWRQDGIRSATALARAGASWSGPFHPAYKLSPAISSVQVSELAQKADYKIVMLQVFPDADVRELVQDIRDLGIRGVVGFRQGAVFSRVRLLLTPSEIAAHREDLARLGEVFWIDVEPRRVAAQRHHRLGRPVRPLRRPDHADLHPGDLSARARPSRCSTPASTPTCAASATPPAACRRPTPATAAPRSTTPSAR